MTDSDEEREMKMATAFQPWHCGFKSLQNRGPSNDLPSGGLSQVGISAHSKLVRVPVVD